MNSDILLPIYEEWLEVARIENQIIREYRFERLANYGDRKLKLMESVIGFEEQLGAQPSYSEPLRLLIHQVADLEQLTGVSVASKPDNRDENKTEMNRKEGAR